MTWQSTRSDHAQMNIFTGIARGLEAMIEGVSRFAQTLDSIVSGFFHGLVEFLERASRWIVDTTIRIKNYLIRLIDAIGRCIWALFKLTLFYLPSILSLVVFYLFPHQWGWLAFALFWFLFITGVGLTYGRNRKGSEQKNAEN